MINGLNSLDTLFPTQSNLFGVNPMDLSADFGSIYQSLSSQKSKITADSAKRAYLQTKSFQPQVLTDMFADSRTSFLGMGDLFGGGGLFGLPSWANDAERLLGDSQTKKLIDLSRQAAFLEQSQLGNLDSSNGGDIFSSLI